MEVLATDLFVFSIVALVLVVGLMVLAENNRTYCMIFEPKMYKTGEFLCEHLDDMQFVERNEWDEGSFVVVKYAMNVDGGGIMINYYPQDDTVGAWEDGGIIFCGFDKYHEKKIVEWIKAHE